MKPVVALGLLLGLFAPDDGVLEDFENPVLEGWERVSSDAHPPYNSAETVRDPAAAKSGRQFLRMKTQGGSTSIVRSPRRAWPIDAARPYRLSVFARLTGTRRNTAAAAILWLNGDGDPLSESKSAPLATTGGWTEILVEAGQVPPGATSASVRLDFVGDDVRGECDFDRLVLRSVELLDLRPLGRATAVFGPDEPARFEVAMAGAPAGAHLITCVLKGPDGRDVRRGALVQGDAATVDFQNLKAGAYELEATCRDVRRTLAVLVRRPYVAEKLPEIPPALAAATVRGELTDAEGRPTRWWLAQQTMHEALDGALPMADPGIFPSGVRVAAFRKAASATVALWSDPETDVRLFLNAGADLWPALGERRPLAPGESVRIGPTPVFVVGIDPLLLELQLVLAGGDLPLQINPSTRTLRLRNPYRTDAMRNVRVRLVDVPPGWRVSPRTTSAATLPPDGILSEDLQISLPPSEVEREQELRFEVSFERGGREQAVQLSRGVRLTSPIRIDGVVTDGPQPRSKRVSVRIVNATDRVLTLVLRARLPFLPEQEELVRSLAPGATSAPFEYVVKDVHLVDPTHLRAEIEVRESVGARAAARKVIPIR